MEFKDKVAVITGGASGIGRSIALALARLGTDVVIADLNEAKLDEVRKEIESMGRRALAILCDVSKDNDVDNLATQSISTMGKVDILINNAGVHLRAPLEKMSMRDWNWIIGINLLGVIRGINAFAPYMIKRGSGYIINTSSGNGLVASDPPEVAQEGIGYCTAKFGVVGLSEGLYTNLRPKGINVSVLCPGLVRTNLVDGARFIGNEDPEILKAREKAALFGEDVKRSPDDPLYVAEPDDVAQLVIEAMKEKRFFIITHPSMYVFLNSRGQDLHKLEKYLQDKFRE